MVEPGAIATPIWEKGLAAASGPGLAMTAEQRERYQQINAAGGASGAAGGADGVPPERVAQVITRAVTARRPRTRYLVGRDAKITARFAALLPDRVMDRMAAAR